MTSVELTTNDESGFVGISRPTIGPLSDLTGGSWMTYITGDTGFPITEAASLKFGGYQATGLTGFTTLVIEPANNGTVAAGAWQTWDFDDSAIVWQTNTDEDFCLQASPCELGDYKTHYPTAHLTGLTVAIGTGVPANTSWVDGISLTADGASDTWDFELAAAPPPTDEGGGGGSTVTVPPTDSAMPASVPSAIRGQEALVVLGVLLAVVIIATSWRPARRRG